MTTKLLLPFITYLLILTLKFFNWITDVDSAISISNKENKPMLLIFTDANSAKAHCLLKFFTLDFAIWAEIMWLRKIRFNR
jgi:hypothetical protein